MIILILINILLIIYVYMKYYRFSISEVNKKIEDEDSILIAYIQDNGIHNNVDLILAQIIELNIKGYIKIEYNKENIDKYNYIIKQNILINSNELKKHELLVMSFLFDNKMEITKKELEEKLSNTFKLYNIQFNELGKILNAKLINEGIIDQEKQKKIPKTLKKYIKISMILIPIICVASIFKIIQSSLLYLLIYLLEKLVIGVLIYKASYYTNEGQSLKYKIDSYKIQLTNEEFLTSNSKMEDIVKNKKFANSLALHIDTQAKQAFINNSIIKNATKVSKRTIKIGFIFLGIITLVGLVLSIITRLLPKEAIFWLYLMIAMMVAGVADVTLAKKK